MLRFLKSYKSGGSFDSSGCVSLQVPGNSSLSIRSQSHLHAQTQNANADSTKNNGNLPPLVINSLDELPQRYKTRIVRSGISIEDASKNISVVLNILHFRYRRMFVWNGDNGKTKQLEKRVSSQAKKRVEYLRGEAAIRAKEVEILHDDNPTEIFEEQSLEAKGGFGKVIRARHVVTDAVVAIKKVKHMSLKQIRDNLQEIMFLEECKDLPNVVLFFAAYKYPPHVWIVMEYVEGAPMSLFFTEKNGTLLSRMTEDILAYITREILVALHALHEHNIAHRDIKPSNIILSIHGPVKLVDFGLCVDVSAGPDYHMVGSSYWMAPEVIKGQLHSTPVDIWGLGIIMEELVQNLPFSSVTNSMKMMFDIAVKGPPKIQQGNFSDQCIDFIHSCLKTEPSERLTADKLLEHPFVCNVKETADQEMGDWVHWAFYESSDEDRSDRDYPEDNIRISDGEEDD